MKMQRTILVVLIAFAGSGIVNAQGPIDGTIYGRININAELLSPYKGDSTTDIVSNASRLGFEGATSLSEGLEVIYQIEYEVHLDDGDKDGDVLSQRNSFLGLKGRYGTILTGKHDTPTKMTQNRVDLFNDMISDIRTVLDGENRENDIVLYRSPSFSGFSIDLATIAGGDDDNFTSSLSGSISYSRDAFYAALGLDSDVANHDVMRIVAQYFAGPLTLGAIYQRSEDNRVVNAEDEDGFFLSAAYKYENLTLKAQVAESDEKAPGKSQFTAGFDYKLGERTKLFTYYTTIDADNKLIGADHYGLGFEHNF